LTALGYAGYRALVKANVQSIKSGGAARTQAPPPVSAAPAPAEQAANAGANHSKAEQPPASGSKLIEYFYAQPALISDGHNATLRWHSSNGIKLRLDGSAVPSVGEKVVRPHRTTTYVLQAQKAEIDDYAYTSIRVIPPPPLVPIELTVLSKTFKVYDVYFDPGEYELSDEARTRLTMMLDTLREFVIVSPLQIEAYADMSSDAELALGLGDLRASAVREFLVKAGLRADRIRTVSYGSEQPIACNSDVEVCRQLTRRAHFVPGL